MNNDLFKDFNVPKIQPNIKTDNSQKALIQTPVNLEVKEDEFVNNESVVNNKSNKKDSLLGKLYNVVFKNSKNKNSKGVFEDTIINTASTTTALAAGVGIKKATTILSTFIKDSKTTKGLKALNIAVPILAALGSHFAFDAINNIPADKETRKENKKSGFVKSLSNAAGAMMISAFPALVPVGFALNGLTSYISRNKENADIKDFIDTHKETIAVDAIAMGTILLAGFKGKSAIENVNKALEKAKINIQNPILYRMPADSLTEFQSLARDLGFDLSVIINKKGSVDIKKIATLDEDLLNILLEKGQEGNIEGKMKKIEEMNIFLPKYFQTVVDIPDDIQANITKQIDAVMEGYKQRQLSGHTFSGSQGSFMTNMAIDEVIEKLDKKGLSLEGFKDYQSIIQRIKSDCPTSRTIDEAQQMIDKAYGAGKYVIDQSGKKQGLLGVGSIAESYIAHDENGEEVVVKLVKKHLLDGSKVEADKTQLLKKIDEKTSKEGEFIFGPSKYTIRSQDKNKYDKNQIENMCKVWGLETDLSQEAISAQQIGEQATKYQAIKAIDSKPGIFIMEKAKGIQLDSTDIAQKWQEAGLDEADFANFVDNYIGAYCEQLFSLPQKGEKVVQSDPHGGNILVDLANIKNLKDKNAKSPITIIDYGNTTKTTRLDAAKNLFNHIDYLFGNTDGIAESILEGANLNGKSKKAVINQLSAGLKRDIFNCDTKIDVNNPIEIFRATNSYCTEFMQKNNIIPNASNINQMKAEETYILSNLGCLKRIADGCNYDLSKVIDKKNIIKQLVGEMSKSTLSSLKTNPIFTIKQLGSRIKFVLKDPEAAFSCLGANFELL